MCRWPLVFTLLAGGLAASLPAVALPLWELKDTGNRIVLLGSIHYLRSADYPPASRLDGLVEAADVVVMELDMDDQDPQANSATLTALAIDTRGRGLRVLLGAQAWATARARAAALDIDLASLGEFEPWYAALAVTQLRLAQLGFDPALGIESRLMALADKHGREIHGLESFAGQLRTLDTLPADAQREFLLATLEEAAETDTIADTTVDAWTRVDLRTLEDDLLQGVKQQRALYRQLVVERNAHFAEAIAALAGDGRDYLIVIGTLHLVGPDSVLRLLERRGIASQPLP